MVWMLKTNVLIAASNAHAVVLARLRQHVLTDVCISSVVWAEIEFGIAKSVQRARNRQVFDSIVQHMHIIPFSPQAARHYGELRAALERNGTPIGSNDTLIAAEALAQGATLMTDNIREFSRVPGLLLENWLRH